MRVRRKQSEQHRKTFAAQYTERLEKTTTIQQAQRVSQHHFRNRNLHFECFERIQRTSLHMLAYLLDTEDRTNDPYDEAIVGDRTYAGDHPSVGEDVLDGEMEYPSRRQLRV